MLLSGRPLSRREEFVKKQLIDAINNISKHYLDSAGREYSTCSWLFFSIMIAIIVNYLGNPSVENLWVLALAIVLVLFGYWYITRNYRNLVSKVAIENMMNVWAVAESKFTSQQPSIVIKLIDLKKEPLILFGSIRINIKYVIFTILILIIVICFEQYIEKILYAMFGTILIIGLIRLLFLIIALSILYIVCRYGVKVKM